MPAFADWCAVDLTGADGQLRRVAVAHADPARDPQVRSCPGTPRGPTPRTGPGTSSAPGIGDGPRHHRRHARRRWSATRTTCRPARAGLRSYLCVPLIQPGPGRRGRVVRRGRVGPALRRARPGRGRGLAGGPAIAIDNARLYQELQEADRRKDEFLAMLAHELRNPLAPIRNAPADPAAGRRPTPTRPSGPATMMERQVAAHGPAGRRPARRVPDHAGARSSCARSGSTWRRSSRRAVETSRPLIEAAGHELTVDPARPSRSALDADPTRLAQVFANLLNNAAKYTDRGRADLADRRAAGRRGGRPGAGHRHRHRRRACCRASSTCSPRWTGAWSGRRAGWASA